MGVGEEGRKQQQYRPGEAGPPPLVPGASLLLGLDWGVAPRARPAAGEEALLAQSHVSLRSASAAATVTASYVAGKRVARELLDSILLERRWLRCVGLTSRSSRHGSLSSLSPYIGLWVNV